VLRASFRPVARGYRDAAPVPATLDHFALRFRVLPLV
jgi:hypothetical protein